MSGKPKMGADPLAWVTSTKPARGTRVSKTIKQQVDKPQSQQVYKRATYYLKPESIKQLKLLAVKREKEISTLVREIIEDYLSKQPDL